MKRRIYSPRTRNWTSVSLLLLVAGLISGCALLDIGQDFTPEPAAQGLGPDAQRPLSTVQSEPSHTPAVVEEPPTPENDTDQEEMPSHTPTVTSTPTPDLSSPTPIPPTPIPITWTPMPVLPPGPKPSPTPVSPLPGLVISDDSGLWWITAGPVILTTRSDAVLSPNGQNLMFQQDDDIWIQNLATGEERNLTGQAGRINCCARWWPARPDTILLGSWPFDDDIGPTSGFLTSVNIDGSEYRVLDDEFQSNASSGPSPDGQTIAYDRGGTSWLYQWDAGAQPLDPSAFGLENVVRIGGPAWSPSGEQIAWTVAVTDPEWHIALAIFDLSTGAAHLLHPYENAGRGGWFPPPAWSPDGRWLAFVAEDIIPESRGVWAVAADGSQEAFLGPGWNPIWAPNGHYLVYNAIPDPTTGQTIPTLAVPESWYQIPFALAPGSNVLQWIEPQ